MTAAARILSGVADAVGRDGLPPRLRDQGRAILGRIRAPVRVALLGPPGGGKSELLNLLAGRALVPVPNAFASVEIVRGPRDRTVLRLDDGFECAREGLAVPPELMPRVADLRLETCGPALERFDLMECYCGETAEERAGALRWAAGAAQIVLWCSETFGPEERALWARAPQRVRDHGYLVLTKADRLSAGGRTARAEALRPVARRMFRDVLSIGRPGAAEGADARGAAFRESGALSLRDALRRHVSRAVRADLDGAMMFLSRVGVPLPPDDARPPRSDPANADPPGASASTGDGEGLARAAARIDALAARLRAHDDPADAVAAILDACADCALEVADLATAAGDAAGSEDGLAEDAAEACDLILLLQVEGGASAAADAVSILGQLRREITRTREIADGSSTGK